MKTLGWSAAERRLMKRKLGVSAADDKHPAWDSETPTGEPSPYPHPADRAAAVDFFLNSVRGVKCNPRPR